MDASFSNVLIATCMARWVGAFYAPDICVFISGRQVRLFRFKFVCTARKRAVSETRTRVCCSTVEDYNIMLDELYVKRVWNICETYVIQ